MNTTEFLSLVLPAGEHYFAAELRSTGMVHHHASNTEELAARIGKRSKSENNIYYSMASYKQESYINAKGKTKQRTQENVDKLRCFWVDLDCKGKESDYADQTAAAAGLKRFAADSGVGLPTVVFYSVCVKRCTPFNGYAHPLGTGEALVKYPVCVEAVA